MRVKVLLRLECPILQESLPSLKLTASLQFAPENSWLEDYLFFWGPDLFSETMLVSGRLQ